MMKRLKASCVQAAEPEVQHTSAGMQQTADTSLVLTCNCQKAEATRHASCAALCPLAETADCIEYVPQCSCCSFWVNHVSSASFCFCLMGIRKQQRHLVKCCLKLQQQAIFAPHLLFSHTVESSFCWLHSTHAHSSIECSRLCILAGRKGGGVLQGILSAGANLPCRDRTAPAQPDRLV